MKYAKFKQSYSFKDLNKKEIREKYSDSLVYTRSYPSNFYLWFAYNCNVIFFKRPQFLSKDMLVVSVTIKTDSRKAAKLIARNLTDKELKRVFNKCESIIL